MPQKYCTLRVGFESSKDSENRPTRNCYIGKKIEKQKNRNKERTNRKRTMKDILSKERKQDVKIE